MPFAPFKPLSLALLLFLPSHAAVTPGQDPPDEPEIVIDDDYVLPVGDGPFVLRLGRDSRRGYLGVRLMGLNPELREHFGAPRDSGVLVSQVEPESPAGKAGIGVGDIITKVDGEEVESSWEISRIVSRKKAGESVKIEVLRDRAPKQLTATMEERKRREMDLGESHRDAFRRHRWIIRDLDSKRPLLGHGEDFGRLQERLEELEKKVKELEKRLPAR